MCGALYCALLLPAAQGGMTTPLCLEYTPYAWSSRSDQTCINHTGQIKGCTGRSNIHQGGCCIPQVRFLLPVLPLFNIAAAAGAWRLWNNRKKSVTWRAGCCCAMALLAATLAATVLMTAVSRHNYPGGYALAELHRMEVSEAVLAQHAGVTLSKG